MKFISLDKIHNYIDTIHVVDTVFNLIEVKGAPDTVYIEVAKKKDNKKKK